MNDDELICLIALKKTPFVGDITAKKMIAYFGSATNIYQQKKHQIEKIDGIGTAVTKNLFNNQYIEEAEKELEFAQKNNIRIFSYTDDAYPSLLKQCADAPVVLFQKGNINLAGKRILSIVGTRNITTYGQAFCEKLIEDLARLDVVIVSGMAYGVDITAHKAALKYGLQTIGCMAHGLDTFYPSVHQKYADEIAQNGGFFTDFTHGSKFDRKNFLSRNRIIAGLSEATVVIESGAKGGSLVTADIAFSYNRDVFAVPGRATDPYSIGCNQLIRNEKAQILLSAQDLINSLNWDDRPVKSIQKEIFVTLTDDEQQVADFLRNNGKQLLDSIAINCGMPVFKVSNLLFQMEMKDVIRPLPGKMFELIG